MFLSLQQGPNKCTQTLRLSLCETIFQGFPPYPVTLSRSSETLSRLLKLNHPHREIRDNPFKRNMLVMTLGKPCPRILCSVQEYIQYSLYIPKWQPKHKALIKKHSLVNSEIFCFLTFPDARGNLGEIILTHGID